VKLIIEGGSSRTQSVVLDQHGNIVKKANTTGINPVTDPNFKVAVHELISKYLDQDLTEIYHYGSGCINNDVNGSIKYEYANNLDLSESDIHVTDDLIGSAKSACQHQPGIVVICGTGSISGYYDGVNLNHKLASGGYLLGDEGSGFDLGRKLMIRYVRNQLLPQETAIIQQKVNLTQSEFISTLYNIKNVRKYLAEKCSLLQDMTEATRASIISEGFTKMCESIIAPLHEKYSVPVHFIGSVSFHFQGYLQDILKKSNILAGSFRTSAIEGLINYHRHE